MITLGRVFAATSLLTLLGASAAQAQDLGVRPLRYGNTSGWSYDNRDDDRDMPTNGFFPGNFTADPSTAWLGAAGVLAGNSYRSPLPYPSQVVIGASPYQNGCAQRYRSYDPASATYIGKDGLRAVFASPAALPRRPETRRNRPRISLSPWSGGSRECMSRLSERELPAVPRPGHFQDATR